MPQLRFSKHIHQRSIHLGFNAILQADMLAMAGLLRTLKQNINHAEASEMTMREQNKISGISDVARRRHTDDRDGPKCNPFKRNSHPWREHGGNATLT